MALNTYTVGNPLRTLWAHQIFSMATLQILTNTLSLWTHKKNLISKSIYWSRPRTLPSDQRSPNSPLTGPAETCPHDTVRSMRPTDADDCLVPTNSLTQCTTLCNLTVLIGCWENIVYAAPLMTTYFILRLVMNA